MSRFATITLTPLSGWIKENQQAYFNFQSIFSLKSRNVFSLKMTHCGLQRYSTNVLEAQHMYWYKISTFQQLCVAFIFTFWLGFLYIPYRAFESNLRSIDLAAVGPTNFFQKSFCFVYLWKSSICLQTLYSLSENVWSKERFQSQST